MRCVVKNEERRRRWRRRSGVGEGGGRGGVRGGGWKKNHIYCIMHAQIVIFNVPP